MNRCLFFMLLVSVAYTAEWCSHKGKYLSGYANGVRGVYNTLAYAQSHCLKLGNNCGGVTYERYGVYTLRKGSKLNKSPSGEVSWLRGACVVVVGDWCASPNKYLSGYATGKRVVRSDLVQAQVKCLELGSQCGGVTKERTSVYSLRKGAKLINSPTNEISYMRGACPVTERLLSQGRSTTQSSTAHGGSSSRAVDGNTSGTWSAKSCTHSMYRKNNWWQVDLGANRKVSRVVISNRSDCCGERINGTKVYVGTKYCGTIAYKAGVKEYTVKCPNFSGYIVKLVQDKEILTLCEVKVYGSY